MSAFCAALLSTVSAYAATSCGGTETSFIACDDQAQGGTQVSGIWSILLIVLNIMTAGVGVLAVAGFVYAAIMYTTAEDKVDQVNKAKGIMTNTVIGLVAFALMFSGLQYLIPGGAFNTAATRVSTSQQNNLPGAGSGGATTGGNTNTGGNNNQNDQSGGGTDTTAGVKTVKNLRDASASSGSLKSGVLFRSGHLGDLTPANSQKLSKLLGNGATIIDLRTADQRAEKPDKPVSHTTTRLVPIKGVLDTEPMVTDPNRSSQLAKALKLAANAKGSVLIHCVAGKDRTGWMVAMIMYVNGASNQAVMTEYLKSNEAKNNGIVKREWLNSGLTAARNRHGSVLKYLKAIGLSDSDITKLKKKFGK